MLSRREFLRLSGLSGLLSQISCNKESPVQNAQNPQYSPIRFGKNRQNVYQISAIQYFDFKDWDKKGNDWGHIYLDENGKFELYGILNGIRFLYCTNRYPETMHLTKGDIETRFFNFPTRQKRYNDRVEIQHRGSVHLGSPSFLEKMLDNTKESAQAGKKAELGKKFVEYYRLLNIDKVRKYATTQ